VLTAKLENKAGAKASKPLSAADARVNLKDVETAVAKLETELRQAEADLAGSYSSGNVAHIATLRARRDALYQQQAGLAQDLSWARDALTAAEGRDSAAALEQEIAALSAKYVASRTGADAALEGVAAMHRELVGLHGERHALETKLAAHARRFGSAPQMLAATDLLRAPTGFVGVFERVVQAMERIATHRAFLGDATTEAEATQRRYTEEWQQERANRNRMADEIDRKVAKGKAQIFRIARRPGAAA
jgi:hypothetical protein